MKTVLSELYARNFSEILASLLKSENLKYRMISLIESRPIPGKALEDEMRILSFREILIDLVKGVIPDLETAYNQVRIKLPENTSKFAYNTSLTK